MNDRPIFDPFWFYKRLAKSPGKKAIPELVMPSGDDVWSGANGEKVKWREGWRSCWHAILKDFAPHAEMISPVRYSKKHPHGLISSKAMTAYQPESGKQWLGGIDDSQLGKRVAQPLHDHGVENYQLLNNVFGWGLNCTLNYCRYRMGWGHWSNTKRDSYKDKADTFFFQWPRSQMACKFLVNWCVKFANARRMYHEIFALKLCNRKSDTNLRQRAGGKRGRPRDVKGAKHLNEDLWLILIWPVALHHRWNYKDVVRAVRLHFGCDYLHRPAPRMTPSQASKAIENFFERQRPGIKANKYTPKRLVEWRSEALQVTSADAEAIRIRCKRLDLEKLNPGRRDTSSEPRCFDFAHCLHATE